MQARSQSLPLSYLSAVGGTLICVARNEVNWVGSIAGRYADRRSPRRAARLNGACYDVDVGKSYFSIIAAWGTAQEWGFNLSTLPHISAMTRTLGARKKNDGARIMFGRT